MFLGKNQENLQVPAGVTLCLELMRVSAGVMLCLGTDAGSRSRSPECDHHVGDPNRERFTTAGRTRAYEHTNPKPAEKSFQDLHCLRYAIIAKDGKVTTGKY